MASADLHSPHRSNDIVFTDAQSHGTFNLFFETSHNLLDGWGQHFVQAFMVPTGGILVTEVNKWLLT